MTDDRNVKSARGSLVDYAMRAFWLAAPILIALNFSEIDQVLFGLFENNPFSADYRFLYVFILLYSFLHFLLLLLKEYWYDWGQLIDHMDWSDPSNMTDTLTRISLKYTEINNDATRAFVYFLVGGTIALQVRTPENAEMTARASIVVLSFLLLIFSYAFQTRLSFGREQSFGESFINKLYRICKLACAGANGSWDSVDREIKQENQTEHFKKHWPHLYSALEIDPKMFTSAGNRSGRSGA